MDKELLQAFCGTYPRASVPWSDGEFTFATDAITLIRVPRLADVPEIENPYNTASIYNGETAPTEGWLELPSLEMLGELKPCPKCGGATAATCPECDGEGVVILSNSFNEYECECRSCDGNGETNYCSTCKGMGTSEAISSVDLAGSSFTTAFLRKFHLLPGCKIAPPTGDGRFAWLKFEGGDGLTMPRTKALDIKTAVEVAHG